MRQKYLIFDNDKDQLIIRELGELDKEEYTLTCEEIYPKDKIKAALGQGRSSLLSTLKTKNLYPPQIHMKKIAAAVIEYYKSGAQEQVEVLIDDMESISHEAVYIDENENVKIDELIDEAIDTDTFSEDDEIKSITENGPTSLKVADDDSIDIDEEGA